MITQVYKAQVDLLLQVLHYIAKEEMFALKDGTAINLFVRDMPRLSVDIDLTYLPINSRKEALSDIQKGLGRIKVDLEKNVSDLKIHTVPLRSGTDVRFNCQGQGAQIKIEVKYDYKGKYISNRTNTSCRFGAR